MSGFIQTWRWYFAIKGLRWLTRWGFPLAGERWAQWTGLAARLEAAFAQEIALRGKHPKFDRPQGGKLPDSSNGAAQARQRLQFGVNDPLPTPQRVSGPASGGVRQKASIASASADTAARKPVTSSRRKSGQEPRR